MTTRRRWYLLLGAAVVVLGLGGALVVPGWLRERHRQELVTEIANINLEHCLDLSTSREDSGRCLDAHAKDLER